MIDRDEGNGMRAVTVGSGLSLTSIGFVVWIVFISLKCSGAWDVPWFWVWFPLWLPWAIEGGLFVLLVLICLIVALVGLSCEGRRH